MTAIPGMVLAQTAWVPASKKYKEVGWNNMRFDEDRPTDELPLGWQWLRIIIRLDHDDFH